MFLFLCEPADFVDKLLKLICFPFANQPNCLTVRQCYMHWRLNLKKYQI